MMGVEFYDLSNTVYLRVEGRFAGTYAESMRAMVMCCTFPPRLVVDLSHVSFVDAGGKEVLSWLGRIGAQFVADSFYSVDLCESLQLPTLDQGAPAPEPAHMEDVRPCAQL